MALAIALVAAALVVCAAGAVASLLVVLKFGERVEGRARLGVVVGLWERRGWVVCPQEQVVVGADYGLEGGDDAFLLRGVEELTERLGGHRDMFEMKMTLGTDLWLWYCERGG